MISSWERQKTPELYTMLHFAFIWLLFCWRKRADTSILHPLDWMKRPQYSLIESLLAYVCPWAAQEKKWVWFLCGTNVWCGREWILGPFCPRKHNQNNRLIISYPPRIIPAPNAIEKDVRCSPCFLGHFYRKPVTHNVKTLYQQLIHFFLLTSCGSHIHSTYVSILFLGYWMYNWS